MLIDTHAHLYLNRFDADREAVLDRARAAGVAHIVQPAIDVPSVHAAIDLCEVYSGLSVMAALHPTEVEAATEDDWEAVATLVEDPRVVAVGESGLDYYWDRSFVDKQHHFLRRHARLAMEADLPLVLHNRDQKGKEQASQDLVRILTEESEAHPRGSRLRGVFHCFGGPGWMAEAILDLGFHIGLGGTLTFKNGGVPEAITDVPVERIVLETDAPYLAPEPHRGTRNEPAYVRHVAERLAEVKGISVEQVERVTTATAQALFGLSEQQLVER